MKKIFILSILVLFYALPALCNEQINHTDTSKLIGIGFHKKNELTPELQIKNIFLQYQKYVNTKSLEKLLNLHDDSYRSSDGYNKDRLKELAIASWEEYPDLKHTIKIVNITVDVDYATVITDEKLIGTTKKQIELVSGNGFINSHSTSIYYLKKCSNEWKITSDFVITEKTALRYGLAKYIPMSVDAPGIVTPNEEYTGILKINTPRQYVALVSINNEPITFPVEKSTEVFRALKSTGIQERLLTSNNGGKNENVVASVGIAKPNIDGDNLSVNLLGIAFLSSRVNVIKHKTDNVKPIENLYNEGKTINE